MDSTLEDSLETFLEGHESAVRWRAFRQPPGSLVPHQVFRGRGQHELEVALASVSKKPRVEDVRTLWHQRQGNRANPLLLVVGYLENGQPRAAVCGPVGDAPPVQAGLDPKRVERLAAAALAEPNRHAAVRLLVPSLEGMGAEPIPGLRNAGLLALHELRVGVPLRPDWARQTAAGQRLVKLGGRRLLEALGFSIAPLDSTSTVLTVGGDRRAVALLLEETETFEDVGGRFPQTSPVSHALALATAQGLPWVVLHRGSQLRLYSSRPDTGVGRRGRAETFVEVNRSLLEPATAGYLPLLFGSAALADAGSVEEILGSSADFAAELGVRLRERLYDAIPGLATSVARRQIGKRQVGEQDLERCYQVVRWLVDSDHAVM